jgi:hypothetical protein
VIDRRAEVVDVGDVLGFLGRGGQADLGGAVEVVQDLAPGRVFGGAAAVALVDDDQVEEVGRELAEELLPLFRAGDRLVQAQIDLVRRCRCGDACRWRQVRSTVLPSARSMVLALVLSLAMAGAKGSEVVDHRLVDQHVAVGQEQDALLADPSPISTAAR